MIQIGCASARTLVFQPHFAPRCAQLPAVGPLLVDSLHRQALLRIPGDGLQHRVQSDAAIPLRKLPSEELRTDQA